VKKALEIVSKFEMVPPQGGTAKMPPRPASGKGKVTTDYSSANEETDALAGVPYYKQGGSPEKQ